MKMSLSGVALSALSLVFLAGCDESRVVGTLTTRSTLRIVSPGGNKQVLNPGSYRAAIRVQDQGAQIFITASGKEVTFKIPKLSNAGDQTVKISAASMKQEFGLSGRVWTDTIPFSRDSTRSCVYDVESRYECHRDRHGEQICDWEQREIPGYQRVHEDGYSAYKYVDINLVNTASQKIGNYSAQVNQGETITNTDYLTGCMRY